MPASAPEAEVVAKWNEELQARFHSRRTKSLALAIAFAVAAAALGAFNLWIFAVCCVLACMIFASIYFEANGHLQHIRKRSKHETRLVPDFSKLAPNKPTSGKPDGPASPGPGSLPT